MSIKYIGVVLVAIIMLSFGNVMAQSSKDSTAIIFVAGACEMCKERIEKAAMERKGVRSAVWDVNTQKLSLVYNAAVITVENYQYIGKSSGISKKYSITFLCADECTGK